MQDLNAYEIWLRYLAGLTEKTTINDTRNALIRYFVPSVGGPIVSAAKGRPIPQEEAEAAFNFLKKISLQQLADAPDWALKTLEERDSSAAQRERVRRDLRNLVDWARERAYLPPPHNPIPPGICDHIKLNTFKGLNLKPTTALEIYNVYLKQLQDRESQNDISNGIIRYFVPGTGGPLPFHKPALNSEVKAALKHLEGVALEYLNEAVSIAIPVLDAFDMSQTQQTRIRTALRDLVSWAREQNYLPHPNSVAPWGGEYTPTPLPFGISEQEPITVFDIYNKYCQYLQDTDKSHEIASLRTVIIRYFIPACGGMPPSGPRASIAEIEENIKFLKQISMEQLYNGTELIETQFDLLNIEIKKRYTPRSRLSTWINWAKSEGDFNKIDLVQKPEPVFNTFYKNHVYTSKRKPGSKLHKARSPVYTLCAKIFPNDYINGQLQEQINNYKKWRLSNVVRPGGIITEEEKIMQLMGWLHRYENIPLNKLSFDCLITKSKLVFWAKDYLNFADYLFDKEKGIQEARQQADTDIQRVQRYLNFVSQNPESQKKYTSVIIAISKFIYQNLIGSDDFPEARDIPVIRRLLQIQAELSKKGDNVPASVSYHENSVPWSEAIIAMEKQRYRAEQGVLYFKNERTKLGYDEQQRPETALANELQRFLSIAFCILVPSRSRTFYDLRIGETFKEGILIETRFLPIEELKSLENWEDFKDSVKFYIHHNTEDYKSGKSMAPVLINNGGWWVELPNIAFDNKYLYEYIYRWLEWGRYAQGAVNHNFFFRRVFSPRPLNCGAWGSRIKNIFEAWTGVKVPPANIRKMFSSQFPEQKESAALLLQHSERIHTTNYDMRHSFKKMQPVIDANQKFIADILTDTLKIRDEMSSDTESYALGIDEPLSILRSPRIKLY